MKNTKKFLKFTLIFVLIFGVFLINQPCFGYPIYAQQAYTNPREATGRIVCANCHLAQKPVIFESPKSVLPNTVIETSIEIPYNKNIKQLLGNGKTGGLNIGAIMILPNGFKLASKEKLTKELLEKTKNVYITPYSKEKDNILVVGPLPGEKYQKIIFPILTPDPKKDKNLHYFKYPIYIGANRGRGQVYPTGEKSNNNVYAAEMTGKIIEITLLEKGDSSVSISGSDGRIKTQIIPKGIELIIKQNQLIQKDQLITLNPNVGGFGQTDSEIVLQNPIRIIGFLFFCLSTLITQTFFVLKKKQFEKVQASELKK
jgi:apocytochrome f